MMSGELLATLTSNLSENVLKIFKFGKNVQE
jgi:hypothetical protein